MPARYYSDKIYPLQDEFLRYVDSMKTGFYLTGGTALSRFYLHHRYSDDLDFFINGSAKFRENVNRLLKNIRFSYEAGIRDEMYVRIMIRKGRQNLKVDFVNDVPFHSGGFGKSNVFSRIDNPLNILSNKISALQRNSAKDIADICFIACSFRFSWKRIIEDAQKKDNWVNPLDVSIIIDSFPAALIGEVNWIKRPDTATFMKKLKVLSNDIVKGGNNSLPSKMKISDR